MALVPYLLMTLIPAFVGLVWHSVLKDRFNWGPFLKWNATLLLFLMGVLGWLQQNPNAGNELMSTASIVSMIAFKILLMLAVFLILFTLSKISARSAIAIASAYGSISLITLTAAQEWLRLHGMVPAPEILSLAIILEFPSLFIMMLLMKLFESKSDSAKATAERPKASILSRLPFLWIFIGVLAGILIQFSSLPVGSFLSYAKKASVTFYLFGFGLGLASSWKQLNLSKTFFVGLIFPALAILLGIFILPLWIHDPSNIFLMTALLMSASYIVAPVFLEQMGMDAEGATAKSMALILTFPLNIFVFLPLIGEYLF